MDHELADVLQVGFDEQTATWWLSCPGCDRRRLLGDEGELAERIPPFLEQHRSCH